MICIGGFGKEDKNYSKWIKHIYKPPTMSIGVYKDFSDVWESLDYAYANQVDNEKF